MDSERDVLAKGNYVTRVVKLDSVLLSEANIPKPDAPKPDAAVATATIDDGVDDAAEGDSQSKLDVHLRESLRILTDALRLNPNPEFWAASTVPAATVTSLHKG